MKKLLIPLLLLLLLLANASVYIADENETIVITQMGKPIRVIPENQPGIYLKLPFVHEINRFSTKFLDYDSSPQIIYTLDKKPLLIDNYAKWKIVDGRRFLETVRTVPGAITRLDDTVYSTLRVELGRHNFHNIISEEKNVITDAVINVANMRVRDIGIEIVDIRIKRADLPEENEFAVFERMKSERKRIASQYLSEGEREYITLKAETDREVSVIISEAYKEAEEIRGKADSEAASIYAEAYSRDPKFYEFYMALDTLTRTIKETETVLLLPRDSILSKYLLGK